MTVQRATSPTIPSRTVAPAASARRASADRRLASDKAAATRVADRIIDSARRTAPKLPAKTRRRREKLLALPRLGRDAEIQVGTAQADNPNDVGPRKIEVQVNRRVDILMQERAGRHISEAAFLTGREIQATFEKTMLSGGSNWTGGDRVDAELAKERTMIRRIETAREVEVEMARLRGEVGDIGARFLRDILTGMTFKDYAARRGHHGERAITDVAKRFRWSLEEISEARAARGKVK